jgi:Tol biopolymer transport system component/DNA-binding winged helix-turn-helix (wHTH) protein
VALTPREFDTLQVLLEHPGQIVSKEILVVSIWKGQVVSEGNLSRQIKNLRQKLGPEGDSLILTFARQGYSIESVTAVPADDPANSGTADHQTLGSAAPRPVAPKSAAAKWVVVGIAAIALGLLAVTLYPKAVPTNTLVARFVALTNDGTPKRGPVLLGGGRIWFQELIDGEWEVVSIPESGGEAIPLKLPFKDLEFYDITADGGVLLFGSSAGGRRLTWAWTVSTGSARLVRDGPGGAAWAPDRHTLAVAEDTKLLIFDGDALIGFATPSPVAYVNCPRWAPDGRHVAFDLNDFRDGFTSIWQSDSAGKSAEPVRAAIGSGEEQVHGRWMKDGSYFLYEAGRHENHDLWAVRAPAGHSHSNPGALRLTSGPLNWTWPTPGATRKDIFALGELARAELVRFDRKASTWLPYLRGIPVYELDFSNDGKWVAYTRYPEHTVWKAKVDGSEQTRLTSPAFEAHQPHWSPDGSEIALIARAGADRWRIFTVPANGGSPAPLSAAAQDAQDQGVPTWSKDGRFIVYGDWLFNGTAPKKIHLFDRLTSRTAVLEGSESLWTPRWSPDGKHISALRQDSTGLMLAGPGLSSGWRQIVTGEAIDHTMWSRDSRYIYFKGQIDSVRRTLFRVSVPGADVEKLADIQDFPVPRDEWWFGVAPDGSPLGLMSVRNQEIYYLESTLR